MLPRRTPDPRDLERAALRALAQFLARLVKGRKGAMAIAFGIVLSLALAPQGAAKPNPEEALLQRLETMNLARMDAKDREEIARAARNTRNPRLARLAVEALRRVGDRESLRLLDAMAGGKTRVPKVDAEAVSVRARLASAEVRMRVAERMIQERLRAG